MIRFCEFKKFIDDEEKRYKHKHLRFIVKRADVSVSCYSMRGSRASGKNQLAIMLPILWKWCCALIRLQISTSEEICSLEDYPISIDRKYCAFVCVLHVILSVFFACVYKSVFFSFDNTVKPKRFARRKRKMKWSEKVVFATLRNI